MKEYHHRRYMPAATALAYKERDKMIREKPKVSVAKVVLFPLYALWQFLCVAALVVSCTIASGLAATVAGSMFLDYGDPGTIVVGAWIFTMVWLAWIIGRMVKNTR